MLSLPHALWDEETLCGHQTHGHASAEALLMLPSSCALHHEGPGGSRWDVHLSLLTKNNGSSLGRAWLQNRASVSSVG